MSQGDYIKRKQISHKLVGDGTTVGNIKGGGSGCSVGPITISS